MSGVPVLCCEHHFLEVSFLVKGKNCYICDLKDLDLHLNHIAKWLSTTSKNSVREVTINRLTQQPLLHELVID